MTDNKDFSNDIAFFKQMAQFRREGDSHSPDAFNEVVSHGDRHAVT